LGWFFLVREDERWLNGDEYMVQDTIKLNAWCLCLTRRGIVRMKH